MLRSPILPLDAVFLSINMFFSIKVTSSHSFHLSTQIMTVSNTSDSQNTLSKKLVVQNKMGVHARPAAMIVRVANTFPGEIWVEKDGEQVNGKSIMGLMMLAAGNGSSLIFRTEGPTDAAENILKELEELFARRFEEA